MKTGLFHTCKNYKVQYLPKDILSGIIMAAVSIPIAMGYAEVAGLPAVYGLYGSVFPILLFATFSTSPHGSRCSTGGDRRSGISDAWHCTGIGRGNAVCADGGAVCGCVAAGLLFIPCGENSGFYFYACHGRLHQRNRRDDHPHADPENLRKQFRFGRVGRTDTPYHQSM